MDVHSAKASEIGDLATFYRITDYGGSVAPADRVVYAAEEERIVFVTASEAIGLVAWV
jgi:hypothetical protein